MSEKKETFFHRQKIQLLFMAAVFLGFWLIIGTSLYTLRTLEKAPALLPNLPQQEVQFGHGISTVHAGLFVRDFTTFNVQEDIFEMVGEVWFEFNPNDISLEALSRFEFENGQIIEKSKPQTKLIDGKAFSVFYTRVRFVSQLLHNLFPLSDHKLFLVLKLRELSPEKVHLEAVRSDFRIAPGVEPEGWKIRNHSVQAGYVQSDLSSKDPRKKSVYPRIMYTFEFEKPGFRKVLIVLGPAVFLFFFSLISLLVDRRSAAPITVTIGALTGLLIHRLVIQSVAPNVGYFTLTDYLYLTILSSTFATLLINAYELKATFPRFYRGLFYYGSQLILLFLFYGLLEGMI